MPRRQLEIVLDIDEEHCNVGREVKASRPTSMTKSYNDPLDASIDAALRSSQVVCFDTIWKAYTLRSPVCGFAVS